MGRLPFCATFVVERCSALTPAMKLLWLKHYALDRGEGCWESSRAIGARISMSMETAEVYRRRLAAAGLLEKGEIRERIATWYVSMPPGTIPNVERPNVGQLDAAAATLAAHIERSGAMQALPNADSGNCGMDSRIPIRPSPQERPNPDSAITRPAKAAAFPGEGGKGGGAPPSPSSVQSVSSSPTSPQGGEVGDRAQRERQGSPPARAHGATRTPAEEGAVQSERTEEGEPHAGAGSEAWQAAKAAVRPPWKDRAATSEGAA